jgi:geranylgeranyl diphosphate synthase type I
LNVLDELSEIGRTAEPVIREYVLRGASAEFREVLTHQLDAGGKMLRPALVMLACEAAGGSRHQALKAAAAMELVHNYSLIFDDIIDRGEIRRGKPTTRRVFGDSMALLAALHYREAIAQVVNDSPQSAALHGLVSKAIENLVEGERMDILYEQAGREEEYVKRARMREPSWETYERIVIHKTASLMGACAEAGALIAGASDEVRKGLGDYARLAGEAFQIADDTLDIFGEETKLGKKVGKDIAEHKLGNAAVLLALNELDADGKANLLSILRKEHVSQEDLSQAIELMRSTGCRDKALKIAAERVELAKRALHVLPDSDAKARLIVLAESFVSRQF